MAQLVERFRLWPQTGALACHYFDRYASKMLCRGSCLHDHPAIISSVCLLLAAKFADRDWPFLTELQIECNGMLSAEQFAILEYNVLDTLSWQLHVPLPHDFVDLLLQTVPTAISEDLRAQTMRLIDSASLAYESLGYTSVEICAGALLGAWAMCSMPEAACEFLPALARACSSDDARLLSCSRMVGGERECETLVHGKVRARTRRELRSG